MKFGVVGSGPLRFERATQNLEDSLKNDGEFQGGVASGFTPNPQPQFRTVSASQGRFQKENLVEFPALHSAFDRYLSATAWEIFPNGLKILCPTSFHLQMIQRLKPDLEHYLGRPITDFEIRRLGPTVTASSPAQPLLGRSSPAPSGIHPDFGPRGSPQIPAGIMAPTRSDFSPRTSNFQQTRGGQSFNSSGLQSSLPIPQFFRAENPTEAEKKRRLPVPNFISSQAFESGYQLTKRWAQSVNVGAKGQALWIHGKPGSGKTTLIKQLHGWIDCSKRLIATDVMAFFHEWRRSMEAQDHLSFVRKYRKDADVLVLENLDELLGKSKTQIEVLYSINAILDRGGSIAVTSVKHPLELKEMLEPSLFSRIFSGLLLEMPEPDLGFKEKLWRKIVEDSSLAHFPIDISVFERLMRMKLDTARKAQSTFINASARISINRRLNMADVVDLEALHATPGMAVGQTKTPQDIIDTVSRLCGVPAAAVMGKVRRANITLTRKFVCLALTRFLGLTNATIAVLLEKDPSTVSHAIRSLEDDLQCDRVIAEQWAWICSQMGMPLAVGPKQV